jgi:flagellar biosynthesis anti-sigma factor FlgM
MRIHDAYTKLDGATRINGAASKGDTAASRGAKDAGASSSSSASMSVTLSAKARELSGLADPSSARIAALRDQVKRGEFKIDADAIAKKLVGDDA